MRRKLQAGGEQRREKSRGGRKEAERNEKGGQGLKYHRRQSTKPESCKKTETKTTFHHSAAIRTKGEKLQKENRNVRKQELSFLFVSES